MITKPFPENAQVSGELAQGLSTFLSGAICTFFLKKFRRRLRHRRSG